MLAEKGFRLAYENWCWATYAAGWKDVWEISQRAGRPNIGICLDTFQSAGRDDKIYLLRISDAYKMEPPLRETSARSRSEWSLSFRPLPYSGGYFPVEDFLGSALGTGFRGWLSVEVFDSKPKEGMLVEDYTKAAMQSLTRLLASTIK
ncbi:3-dehydroshikimate dehydratase [Metarhizium anisopliae]|nr:3-dehydroshikimate dehydratase [Metarhizium anisopliae]